MADFKDMWVSFALVGLMVFGIFAFVINFQIENGISNTILNDSTSNISDTYYSLNETMSEYEQTARLQKQAFDSDSPLYGIGVLVFNTILSSGKIFGGMIISIFNIIIVLPLKYLGIPPIVTGIIGAILIVVITLKLWNLYKVGN